MLLYKSWDAIVGEQFRDMLFPLWSIDGYSRQMMSQSKLNSLKSILQSQEDFYFVISLSSSAFLVWDGLVGVDNLVQDFGISIKSESLDSFVLRFSILYDIFWGQRLLLWYYDIYINVGYKICFLVD